MRLIKFGKVLLTTAMLFSITLNAHAANNTLQADAQATTNECKAEAEASGCRNEVVGKGLLKCMSMYKMAHREFKFSEGCNQAMKKMRADRSAAK